MVHIKGPAVWGMRAQIDRKLYKKYLQEELFHHTPNLEILESSVDDLIVGNEANHHKCKGIILGKLFFYNVGKYQM